MKWREHEYFFLAVLSLWHSNFFLLRHFIQTIFKSFNKNQSCQRLLGQSVEFNDPFSIKLANGKSFCWPSLVDTQTVFYQDKDGHRGRFAAIMICYVGDFLDWITYIREIHDFYLPKQKFSNTDWLLLSSKIIRTPHFPTMNFNLDNQYFCVEGI